MNILNYKRNPRVYFDNLAIGDVFVFKYKVYMKVSNLMISQDEKKLITLRCDGNNIYDFCVNLETGELREITMGTLVEPLGVVEIRKDDN